MISRCQTHVIAELVHLNGPIGVGKSTLARGIVARRRLALEVDIDEIRVRLGSWREDPESKQVARALGFRRARSHLDSGFDVVLPQLLVRFEVIDHVEAIAQAAGAAFTEVVLVAPTDEILARLAEPSGIEPHPRDHLGVPELRNHIEFAVEALRRRARERSNALLVDLTGMDAERALEQVCSAIGW